MFTQASWNSPCPLPEGGVGILADFRIVPWRVGRFVSLVIWALVLVLVQIRDF